MEKIPVNEGFLDMRRALGILVPVLALLAVTATSVAAPARHQNRTLRWSACVDAPGYDCAHVLVPRDYADPAAGNFRLAVVRLPARDQKHRIGSLFVNFGGPGGTGVQTLKSNGKRLFANLNQRFDVVSWDPRGVGESTPAIDCHVDQETAGPFAQPFPTPLNIDATKLVTRVRKYVQRCEQRNRDVLPYVSTANVARDLDFLRRAVGDRKLSYFGMSYGTYLGATYASMFPHSYRAMTLEGVLDPEQYANHPLQLRSALAAAQERATGRFLQYCVANQTACGHFGGTDPQWALDKLIGDLDRVPLDVGSRKLDGDDVRVALGQGLHSRESWPALGAALAAAESGNGAPLRQLADGFYGRRSDGTYRPTLDEFMAISAVDSQYPGGVAPYLNSGAYAWNNFDHAYFLAGYTNYVWGADRVRARGVFRGPFRASPSATPVLVVGTTYDPATPYKAAVNTTRMLGNARLLTMDGDGHGAYGGESGCIDTAVDTYLDRLALPAAGTHCRQDVS